MATIETTRQQLVESQLMTAEAAAQHISTWRGQTAAADDTTGDELVDWLVGHGILTEFQGSALKAGHTGPFMLGPYRVFARVAAGRLGNVYRANHDELNQAVSLKVFPTSLEDDHEKLARMEREFRATAELDHPNIVRSFQIGQAGHVHYLALQDLQGETLADRLNREGAISYPIACKLIGDIARGLVHLHEHGLVHRDVSPANMWITESGNCMLMELGAVRDALGSGDGAPEKEQITTTETVIGTFDYMAPEQAQDAHAADQRSDIYSLGCTLYHCLTGEKPFKEKNPIKLVMAQLTRMAPPLTEVVPDVPPKLSEAVNSMMAKSPDDRFQTAQDVIWALDPHAQEARESAVAAQVATPEYLKWLRTMTEKYQAARSPELAEFFEWLADNG